MKKRFCGGVLVCLVLTPYVAAKEFLFLEESHSLEMERAEERKDCPLQVKIEKIESTKGEYCIFLYHSENTFPDPKQAFRKACGPISESLTVVHEFTDLPCGVMAALAIHDANKDGSLNTNFIGWPKEGFIFSNRAMTKLGAPSFAQAKFYLVVEEKEEKNVKSDTPRVWGVLRMKLKYL